jgi:hypothetical protein
MGRFPVRHFSFAFKLLFCYSGFYKILVQFRWKMRGDNLPSSGDIGVLIHITCICFYFMDE